MSFENCCLRPRRILFPIYCCLLVSQLLPVFPSNSIPWVVLSSRLCTPVGIFDDSARSPVRKIFILKHWCLCVLRTLPLSLSLTCTVVGGRRFRPSVAVVGGRRFRPNFSRLVTIGF